MNTIHIKCQAYNAEKTLRRAIDSILAQTYKNYKIYLCDNGSTDGTKAIVDEYAEKGLVTPFYNEKNRVWNEKSNAFRFLPDNIPDEDYYATLDSDDELFSDFFQTLIDFATENDLDIAAGNYEVCSTATGETAPRMKHKYETILFTEKEDWEEHFLINFPYFMPIWGKLLRGTVCRIMTSLYEKAPPYGGDTLQILAALSVSNRVGCVNKQLMRYYVSSSSVSYTHDPRRKEYPEWLYNTLRDFMEKKAGGVTPKNAGRIYTYWAAEVKESLRVNLGHKISDKDKLDEIEYFFSNKITRDFLRQINYFRIFSERNDRFDILNIPIVFIGENIETLPPARVKKLYNLFFELVYQTNPIKFTENEIAFMLSANINFANAALLGLFDVVNQFLGDLKDSNIKMSIAKKVAVLSQN
jgi:glycosyltransferase involved in cell wall biosynthesis